MVTGTAEPSATPTIMSGWDVLTLEQAADYLQLPAEVIRAEAESGRLPGQRFGTDWRFVRQSLVDAISPPSAVTADGPVRVARPPLRERPRVFRTRPTHPKLAAEYDAFEKMLPELLTTHRGLYVAIHQGVVVAVAKSEVEALTAASRLFPGAMHYARLVTDEPQPIERVGIRRLVQVG